jgi:hypothetical protein
MKRLIIFLMTAALVVPLYSQDKGKSKEEEKKATEEKKAAEEKKDEKGTGEKLKVAVYQEITLEDFETTAYSNKNIQYVVTSDQEASVAIRDQLPSQAPNSKKYLGFKLKTRGGDIYKITLAKEIIIDKHCKSISFWIYGKKTMGELSFLLQDTQKQVHQLRICTIDFIGWKKIQVLLTNKIAQQDDFLNQKKTMKFLSMQYKSAGSREKPAQWQFFYLDDITATVRERYDDKQSDEW